MATSLTAPGDLISRIKYLCETLMGDVLGSQNPARPVNFAYVLTSNI